MSKHFKMATRTYILLLLFICMMFGVQFGSTKKILLLPSPSGSHWNFFQELGNVLRKDYGHDMYVMMPNTYPGKIEAGFNIVWFNVTKPDLHTTQMPPAEREDMWTEWLRRKWSVQLFGHNPAKLTLIFCAWCDMVNGDEELFQAMINLNLDFAIFDLLPMSRCFTVLLHHLGIPYAAFGTMFDPWPSRSPFVPSFVPFTFDNILTEKMAFWERLQNLLSLVKWSGLENSIFQNDMFVKNFLYGKPPQTLNELFCESALVLINSHPLLDKLPLLPHVIQVGGVALKPGKPLLQDVEKFISNAKLSTIVMSFGSWTEMSSMEVMQKFAEAFGKFRDYAFVWKYTGKDAIENLGSHIKTMSWIPQNDLLADNRTKLFLTHCGNNGQMEALKHGVPMIGFPIFADQLYNAGRMAYQGFGIYLDVNDFSTEDLVEGMQKVLGDRKYRNNVQKASRIFHSLPHPKQKAGYWVDHVMKFGDKHLRSYGRNLAWYEYLMLDILLFLVLMVAVPLGCLYRLCARTF